jgi:hypothetical protein
MLQCVIPYKHAISETIRNSPKRLSLLCYVEGWDQLEQLCTFLEVFFNATVQLSCSYTPSAHQLLQHLYLISKVYFFFSSLYLFHYKFQVISLLFYFIFCKVCHDLEDINTIGFHTILFYFSIFNIFLAFISVYLFFQ